MYIFLTEDYARAARQFVATAFGMLAVVGPQA